MGEIGLIHSSNLTSYLVLVSEKDFEGQTRGLFVHSFILQGLILDLDSKLLFFVIALAIAHHSL